MTARGEWEYPSYVPDLTWGAGEPTCPAETPDGRWRCTRRRGHGGRHAAGDGYRIVAVWNQTEGES